jgi:hypothetical protein
MKTYISELKIASGSSWCSILTVCAYQHLAFKASPFKLNSRLNPIQSVAVTDVGIPFGSLMYLEPLIVDNLRPPQFLIGNHDTQ